MMLSRRCLVIFQLCSLLACQSLAQLSQCANHPATKNIQDFKPVLLQKWDQPSSDGDSQSRAAFSVRYQPRVADIKYVPKDTTGLRGRRETEALPDLSGGLDLIIKEDEPDKMERHRDSKPKFTFHREATVYMLVTANFDLAEKEPKYSDWTSLGWFRNEGTRVFNWGIHHSVDYTLDENVYVFSKQTTLEDDGTYTVYLPSYELVYTNSKFIMNDRERDNNIIWLVGEADGAASPVPQAPTGVADDIVPGRTCPESLHDLWKMPVADVPFPDFNADSDIQGKEFATWHPIFDPCYWCAYDHEHGSDASSLVGPEFAPTFTYTAWKNGRQDESVPGFKSFVFKYKRYMVIYDTHIQLSQVRRFQTPIHTGTMSIVDVKDPVNPQLLLKLTQKVDFGPLEFMNKDGDKKPVNKTATEEFDALNQGKMFRRRTVNNKMSNEYERWDTKPMCAKDTSRGTVFRIRITNPNTAIDNFKNTDPSEYTAVTLKRPLMRDGTESKQVGMRRQLIVKDIEIGVSHCETEILNFVASRQPNGVFYTNAMGTEAFPEPAEDRMWQYIHPNFDSLNFANKTHVKMENAWETLYTGEDFNFPEDIPMQDALDPDVN